MVASPGVRSTAFSAKVTAVAGSLLASAARARVASPTSPFCWPDALLACCCGAEQPAITVASATSEMAEPKRKGLDIVLPPHFGLFGHSLQFGHVDEQLIERVGHKLLRGTSVHRACES